MRKLSILIVLLFANLALADVHSRLKDFQAIMDKIPSPDTQIKKAETLAADKKSPYRINAINYLIDHKSTASAPLMVDLVKDIDVREFAIYGVGELGVTEATPLLIYYLKDDNQNVRGNAFRSLEKIYPRDFNFPFRYDDPAPQRSKMVKEVEKWWEVNKETLKNRDIQRMTDAEQKEALERWEKYGKEYLNRTR